MPLGKFMIFLTASHLKFFEIRFFKGNNPPESPVLSTPPDGITTSYRRNLSAPSQEAASTWYYLQPVCFQMLGIFVAHWRFSNLQPQNPNHVLLLKSLPVWLPVVTSKWLFTSLPLVYLQHFKLLGCKTCIQFVKVQVVAWGRRLRKRDFYLKSNKAVTTKNV